MSRSQPILLTIEFPDLAAQGEVDKVRALREFTTREVPGLEFVERGPEGHLGIGLTFAVMIAVPTASLLWHKFFSDFQPRQPGLVRIQIDGKTVFEGYAADPAAFPTIDK